MKNLLLISFLFFMPWLMQAQEGLPVWVSTTTGNIYEVNINDCSFRFICATHKQLFDIAFTPDGRLWGNTIDSLFRIDTINGSLIPIGECPLSSALLGLSDSFLIIEHAQNLYSINNIDASTRLLGYFGCFGTDGDFTWYNKDLFITCNGHYVRISLDSTYSSITNYTVINDTTGPLSVGFPGLATVYSNDLENKILAFASYNSGIDLYALNITDTTYQILCLGIVDTGSVYGATSMVFPPSAPNSITPIDVMIPKFTLYPNPATDKIYVELHFLKGDEDIELAVYNYLGRLVLRRQVQSGKTTINVNNYPPGLYVLQLTSQHQICTRKFLKL